ncbi:MAG: tripartite tricarboxylate transporter substrate binding protein, partial [Pseudolabrys sp.]
MNWLNRIAAILTVPMITVAAAGSATAEAYPSKPIDMIVTWNAGGSTDVIARLMAGPLGKRLGEPVAVANRVGGGGSLGTRAALHAPKDGYTILMTTSGNHILTPLKHDVGYRYDDFTPVGQLFSGTIILAVRADSPWKSLDQLVKAAKARPNKYTFGAVSGVMPYLDLESLAHTAGFKVVHVPEQGGAPGAIALLAGDIDMLPANAATVSANIKAGKMRALAVFNEKRDPAFPNVPTATEQGYPVIGSP